jgi:hypothetical protein
LCRHCKRKNYHCHNHKKSKLHIFSNFVVYYILLCFVFCLDFSSLLFYRRNYLIIFLFFQKTKSNTHCHFWGFRSTPVSLCSISPVP